MAPRPFRNPDTIDQVGRNYAWQLSLVNTPPGERPEGWAENAAWRVDEGRFLNDNPYATVRWPEDVPQRRGLRRDGERDGLEPNGNIVKRYPAMDLEKIPEGPYIPRDINLSPFRVDYDTHEQLHQKLAGTVVLVKNMPMQVMETGEVKGKFLLALKYNGKTAYLPYDELKDCRSIAPGYFMYDSTAYWIYRVPERQNSQGMSPKNMHYKAVGSEQRGSAQCSMLQQALSMAKDVEFHPKISEVLSASATGGFRLTNKVAIYQSKKKGAEIAVEYIGRPMGLIIKEHIVRVYDESDLQPSWIHKDLAKAGLVMTA